MSGGTFNVSRRIWSHPVFKPSKYSEREAFLWMVSEASWKARTIRSSDGKNIIDLDRSQLSHSLRFMSDKWGWTKSTAERFLKKLEKRDMIKTSDGTAQNIITVCKYDEYQSKPNESGTVDGTQGGTDAGQTRDKEEEGLNKGNNVSSGKEQKNPKSKIPDNWVPSKDDYTYAISKNIKPESIEELANEFQAYWYDRSDRDSKKSQRGWSQCWQSHVRRAANRPEYRNVAGGQKTLGYGQGGGIADIAAQRRAGG